MPKNAKDMKLNPNRDSHSSFSEDVHSKKQTNKLIMAKILMDREKKTPITAKSAELKNYQL